MTLISNRCIYSGSDPTGIVQVEQIDLGNGFFAFKNSDNKYASARADGSITFVDTTGLNESFELKDGFGKVIIGEGPRVIKVF